MEFDAAVAELDALVGTLEREGDERALMLLELIDAIHRPALALIAAGETEHPMARALLAMYALAPVDDHVQVEEALDEVRDYVEARGGGVAVMEVEDGVVHLRVSGACAGPGEEAVALRTGIEKALRECYEGFRELVTHEPEPGVQLPLAGGPGSPLPLAGGTASGSQLPMATREAALGSQLPIVQVGGRPATASHGSAAAGLRRPVFADVGTVEDVPTGGTLAVLAGDVPVLLLGVSGDVHAFRNGCAVDGLPLEGGRLTDAVLVCPWHNCAYDARSGKRLDEPGEPGLRPVPVAVRDGALRVAVDVA